MIAGWMLRLLPLDVQRCCQCCKRTADCWKHLCDGCRKPAALAHSARHAILIELGLRHLTTTCKQNTWPGPHRAPARSACIRTNLWSAVHGKPVNAMCDMHHCISAAWLCSSLRGGSHGATTRVGPGVAGTSCRHPTSHRRQGGQAPSTNLIMLGLRSPVSDRGSDVTDVDVVNAKQYGLCDRLRSTTCDLNVGQGQSLSPITRLDSLGEPKSECRCV